MSKENNLKDYLTDLYDGISSKKPDASRNPQNFRAEIEAIKTGGIPWDGDYTIEGDALPEPPKAYHLTSADDLPTDAVDGSLAVVTQKNEVTMFKKKITNFDTTIDNNPVTISMEFESYDPYNIGMGYTSLIFDGNVHTMTFGRGGPTVFVYSFDTSSWQHEECRLINITKMPTDEAALAWLHENTTNTTTTLYSRENGEWVNKGEI